MPCYMKCTRCGTFKPCSDSGNYNRPPRLPEGWAAIIFHEDKDNVSYNVSRVVCAPCAAFFIVLIDDKLPHKEP